MCIGNWPTELFLQNKLGDWNATKGKYIQLPKKNGKIALAFMKTFIFTADYKGRCSL